jgi:2-methylcitrate dehydratase
MDRTADRISEYAASLSISDITPEALHAAKRSLVDSVGCALGAFFSEPIKIARRLAGQMSGTNASLSSSVLGTRLKVQPDMAAFVNGFMIRYLDFNDDDISKESGPHPSDAIAAIMAISEAVHADGKALTQGITLAYEIIGHLVDRAKQQSVGWDYGYQHAMGVSMGAGKVLGLSKEQMAHALSLAIIPNMTLRRTRTGQLSMWKAGAGPNGGRNGLFAAMLAWEGMTGPSEPIEGRYGLWDKVTEPFELDPFGGKGQRFKIEDTFFKPRPIMYPSLLIVETALELRDKVDINDIESIKLYPPWFLQDNPEFWDPHTRETADHSQPYALVAALVDGEISEKSFTPDRFRNPQILDLLKKLTMETHPNYEKDFPETFHCRIEVTDKSGKKYVQERKNNIGHPANPMSDAEIEEKFCKLTERVLTPKQTRTVLDLMWHLEELDDVSKIFDILVI